MSTKPSGAMQSVNAFDSPSDALAYIHSPVLPGLERVKTSLRDMVNHKSSFLAQLLDHALETKGKRVRPTLTLLAAGFHPNDGTRAETMATAVELLHIASLIHDDTVDQSEVRRGRATISKVWGGNAAVVLGDYLFATSATYVCDTGNIRVIRRFAETIKELSSGEMEEMVVRYDADQSREQYFTRIYEKTASLFTTATESGAVLSDAPESTVKLMRDYGYSLGMAFQIVDDILDVEGLTDEIGKPVGNDLRHGVLTLPMILALERWPDSTAIRDYFAEPSDGVLLESAMELISDPQVIADSYAVAEEFCQSARDAISELPKNRSCDSLEALIDYVVVRRS